MFGIGTSELLLICVLALVILGPRKLPEIAYKIGKAIGMVKRMSAEFQRNLNVEVATLEDRELRKKQAEYDAIEIPCTHHISEDVQSKQSGGPMKEATEMKESQSIESEDICNKDKASPVMYESKRTI